MSAIRIFSGFGSSGQNRRPEKVPMKPSRLSILESGTRLAGRHNSLEESGALQHRREHRRVGGRPTSRGARGAPQRRRARRVGGGGAGPGKSSAPGGEAPGGGGPGPLA